MKKSKAETPRRRPVKISADVHRLLFMRRAETGVPVWRIADEAIRAALGKPRTSAA